MIIRLLDFLFPISILWLVITLTDYNFWENILLGAIIIILFFIYDVIHIMYLEQSGKIILTGKNLQ